MRRYIKSELYRSLNNPSFIISMGLLSGLSILFNIIISLSDATNDYINTFGFLYSVMTIPVFLMIAFASIITVLDFKEGTIKNTVTSGISRDKIALGKILVTMILGSLSALVVLLIFFTSGSIILNTSTWAEYFPLFKELGKKLIGVFPLWLSLVPIITWSAITLKGSSAYVFLYWAVVSMIPRIIEIIGLSFEKELLVNLGINMSIGNLIRQISMYSGDWVTINRGIITALFYIVIFTLWSVWSFRKKDL